VATRTVRLDDEAERALQEVRETTGLPISEALKQGLHALQERVREEARRKPFDVYSALDLGPGGYAIAPSTESRRGIRLALRRKHGR
jgi:hypothetical protein